MKYKVICDIKAHSGGYSWFLAGQQLEFTETKKIKGRPMRNFWLIWNGKIYF